jgi:uncharacterized protein (TIGR03067 family)
MNSTIQAAMLVAVGEVAATGVISANVVGLTKGVLKSMLLTKLKIAGATLLVVAALGIGAGGFGSLLLMGRASDPKPADGALAQAKEKKDKPDSPPVEALPENLRHAEELLQLLRDSGLVVKSVKLSIIGKLFRGKTGERAVWVKTDQGVVDAVFFPQAEAAKQVEVTPISNGEGGRYKYMVREKPGGPGPVIDANRPLYFLSHGRMVIQTDAREIEKRLRTRELEGIWQVENLQEDGKTAPDEKAISEVVIKGDKLIFKYAKLKHESVNTITLDGSKKPKNVDIGVPGLQGSLPGIYQIDADSLKLCWSTRPDGERPDAFTAKENSGRRLVVLKRKKSAKVEGPKVVETWQVRTRLQAPAGAIAMAVSPDGRTLAVRGNKATPLTITLWDVVTGQRRATLKPEAVASSVAFAPDSTTLAWPEGQKGVTLWDLAKGRKSATLTEQVPSGFQALSVAFSRDGKTVAAGGGAVAMTPRWTERGEIRLWEAATGKERAVLRGHARRVSSVAFSPDTKSLASASLDGAVKLWDPSTGQERLALRGHAGMVDEVVFSPDGKILATASHDETAKLWDAATGQERATLRGHTSWVRCVAFSPDGKTIATGAENGIVKLWDVETGQERGTLPVYDRGGVWSVKFVRDGKVLATGGAGEVKLWELLNAKVEAPKMVETWQAELFQPQWHKPALWSPVVQVFKTD